MRDWLPARTTRAPLTAMNSSAWLVSSGAERYVLKISDASEEACLQVAAWLEARGLRTGAPVQMTVRDGRAGGAAPVRGRAPVANLNVGRRGAGRDPRARLTRCWSARSVPRGLQRWPWSWLEPAVIDDPGLRAAATDAITVAERLAATLTHGILHGDPAPEAFLATQDDVALIDWGADLHGPLMYDVASARMYAGEGALAAYARTSPIPSEELAAVPVFRPSGGPSRRGTSRLGSGAAISPGSSPMRTTTRAWRTRGARCSAPPRDGRAAARPSSSRDSGCSPSVHCSGCGAVLHALRADRRF